MLTKEEALKLHKQMWTDMQNDIGDSPTHSEKVKYKKQWCKNHGFENKCLNDCFLCQYSIEQGLECYECLIDWSSLYSDSNYPYSYLCSPGYKDAKISTILSLPEREVK